MIMSVVARRNLGVFHSIYQGPELSSNDIIYTHYLLALHTAGKMAALNLMHADTEDHFPQITMQVRSSTPNRVFSSNQQTSWVM